MYSIHRWLYFHFSLCLSLSLPYSRCGSAKDNYVHTVLYNVQQAFVCRISLLYENRMVKIRKKASKLTSFRMCDKNGKKEQMSREREKNAKRHTQVRANPCFTHKDEKEVVGMRRRGKTLNGKIFWQFSMEKEGCFH